MTREPTIALEDAEVLAHEAWPSAQHVLRLRAPRVAARAAPGQFVHVACGAGIPMRRPLSLLRADAQAATVDLLYKAVGAGTAALARRAPGESVSLLGPIGVPFAPRPHRPQTLLLGGGVGIPPMVFLAEQLSRRRSEGFRPLVLMGSEAPFPFERCASGIAVPGVPAALGSALAVLERLAVPSRLASLRGFEGCHRGYVTDLARAWLDALPAAERDQVELFACGPQPMLAAVAGLARDYRLPCQVSLEEFMACGVGGCAGCTVRVATPEGPAMKRVCVDGPVFDAYAVFGTGA
jgi:dihydroorotate dehydrogenase electron transfer subunit